VISITSAQLDAWIALTIYPLTRILAFTATVPFLNNAGVPKRVRLMLGVIITFAIVPGLPALPPISPTSGQGLMLLAQQLLIGLGMAFSMRIIYAGIDLAGTMIGLQMGLGFATFYDPQSTSQTAVLSNLLSIVATLLFFAMNGHLVYIATLARSFEALPITIAPLNSDSLIFLARLGARMFSIGTLLSLPVITVLLIINLALGILVRAAPQLNLFAIGFPITLSIGFIATGLMFDYFAMPMQNLFDEGLNAILNFALPPPLG
jgi:flagellar biosynthesis protein FliR